MQVAVGGDEAERAARQDFRGRCYILVIADDDAAFIALSEQIAYLGSGIK